MSVTKLVSNTSLFQSPFSPSSGYTAPKVNEFMQHYGVLETFSTSHCPLNTLTWLTGPGCSQILCHLASFICFVFFSYFILQPYRTFRCSCVKLYYPPPLLCFHWRGYSSFHLWLTPVHPLGVSLEINSSRKPSLPISTLVRIRYHSTVFPVWAICTQCIVSCLFTCLDYKFCEGRNCISILA